MIQSEQKFNDIENLIAELQESNDDIHCNETDSLWDCGFDDGFYSCSFMVISKLKEIINAKRD